MTYQELIQDINFKQRKEVIKQCKKISEILNGLGKEKEPKKKKKARKKRLRNIEFINL